MVRILEKLGIRVAKEPSKETVRDLLEQYSLKPNQENAMKLGRAIANDSAPLEVKKWRFRMALDVVTPDMAVYSTIQAWSSITMLEDNLPASMKITSVKEMLRNPNLENEVLDEILLTIFSRKGVPRDLLNYLAPEFKKASRISEELKSYVNNK